MNVEGEGNDANGKTEELGVKSVTRPAWSEAVQSTDRLSHGSERNITYLQMYGTMTMCFRWQGSSHGIQNCERNRW